MSRKKNRWTWSVFSGGLGSTALIAVVLSLQGLCYRYSYLSSFGLESRQFPLDASGLQYLILHGWALFVSKIFEGMTNAYVSMVSKTWWLAVVMVVVAVLFPLLVKKKPAASQQCADGVSLKEWLRAASREAPWYVRSAFAVLYFLMSVSVMPALLIALSVVFAWAILIAIAPFESIGRDQYRAFCNTAADAQTWMTYRLPGEDVARAGVVIECGSQYCAVIRDRRVEVVLSERMIEMVAGFPNGVEFAGGSYCPVDGSDSN